jgi:hypothetical protein
MEKFIEVVLRFPVKKGKYPDLATQNDLVAWMQGTLDNCYFDSGTGFPKVLKSEQPEIRSVTAGEE